MMKKTLIALTAIQLFSIGVANASVSKDTTFTVSVPYSQPVCGISTHTLNAELGNKIEFTVTGPGNGLVPMVQITRWETKDRNGITSDVAVLENIGFNAMRPVNISKDETQAQDFFILKKRDDVTIPENASDAHLTMELTCFNHSEKDRDMFERAWGEYNTRFGGSIAKLNEFNLRFDNSVDMVFTNDPIEKIEDIVITNE